MKAVIIVAGGKGKRMGINIPKQFLELGDQPVIVHTIQAFVNYDKAIEVIVVLPQDAMNQWTDIKAKYFPELNIKVALGGSERFHSVRNGLELLDQATEVVAIHDAVRPCISTQLIDRCFKAGTDGAAIPVVALTESLRKIEGNRSSAVDRSDYISVQTPQCFNGEALKKAYQVEYTEAFTDDASVWENAGMPIALVEGEPENIKITRPQDLIIAKYTLEQIAK